MAFLIGKRDRRKGNCFTFSDIGLEEETVFRFVQCGMLERDGRRGKNHDV